MCTENQAMDILREVYLRCDEILDQRICDAYLYGSYARGDFDAGSDVDVLLTAEMPQDELAKYRKHISQITSRLSLDYDVTISVTVKPEAHFRQYAAILPYYSNVLREGVRYAK